MSNYCVHIPDQMFSDILEITKDRELTKELWAFSQSSTAQEQFGFGNDISALQLFQKLDENNLAHEILGNESYSRFVTKIENIDQTSYQSFNEVVDEQNRIMDKYNDVVAIIQDNGDGFKIQVVHKDESSQRILSRQKALKSLNDKLVDYIERLGFAVREVDGLEDSGKFSPMNAEVNADGLREVISIAKGKRGQKALPEEIAHLLVEGFQGNPFMQRLMNQMTDDVIQDILGVDYEEYKKEYNDNEDDLKKEAVGRLVAQHLVDRSGIGDQIRFISDKMLDKMRNNLKNGSESDIDGFLRQLQEDVEYFVNSTIDSLDSIELFDNNAVNECKSVLKHIDITVRDLKSVAEDNYNVTAKRMKMISLRQKDQKLTKEQIIEFDKMKSFMEKQDYYGACLEFATYTLEDSKKVLEAMEKLRQDYKDGNINGYVGLKQAARVIRQAEDLVVAYGSPIQSLSSVDLLEDIQSQLPQQDIDNLKKISSEILSLISSIKFITAEMREKILFKVLQNYWGKDKIIKLSNGTEKTISLQDIIESNMGETVSVSRLLNSMADAGDPLLQLMDQMYKDFTNQRDRLIFSLQQQLAKIQQDYLEKTGSRDMRVLYVVDENGKFTGMLKSDIDFLRYHREKAAYRKQLKEQGLSYDDIKIQLKIWDLNHTELVNVAPKGSEDTRMERMPRKDMYHSDDLMNLTQDQRELYNKIIEIKKNLDMLLPSKYTHLYRAPMKKGSVKDQALSGGSIKGMLNRIKSRYITPAEQSNTGKESNITEFGEETQSDQSVEYGEALQIDQYQDGKYVVLDFSGKEVRKIPVFYTRWLDDMSALDTNLIDTMLSYGAMALNYQSMNNIADFMELGNSQMQDRKIIQTSGVRKMFERFKLGETAFQKDYEIPGSKSENARVLRQYIDRNVYGLRKNKETIVIGDKEVNYGNIGDTLKSYSSVVGLGLNLFSGSTNLTMGIAQTLIQCSGGQYFKLKNILKANGLYIKGLPNGIIGQYSDQKKDKLNLLIQKFDCLEEYYNELDSNNFYGGIFRKLVGKWNPMILNSMGEHYLHSISMLAMLDRKQVKIGTDGKLMSLYDALEVKETKIAGLDGREESVYQIAIPENLLNEDESKFTEDDMMQMKSKIQEVNHKMHGAFNDVDRGEANRWVIGRMLMQFRQWMPAFYTSRFRNERLNVVTGETEEGFYRTYFKFVTGFIGDLFRLKFNLLTRYKNLTDSQKANIRMAFVESSLAILLLCLTKMKFMKPDKDDPAFANIVRYNLYRLKMELGAAAPTSLDFLDNIKTLVQSPIPATENIDRLISVLDITLIGGTVKSGRYAGWNKYLRNLYFATPMAKNVGRVVDLIDGDVSMFNPYIKQ